MGCSARTVPSVPRGTPPAPRCANQETGVQRGPAPGRQRSGQRARRVCPGGEVMVRDDPHAPNTPLGCHLLSSPPPLSCFPAWSWTRSTLLPPAAAHRWRGGGHVVERIPRAWAQRGTPGWHGGHRVPVGGTETKPGPLQRTTFSRPGVGHRLCPLAEETPAGDQPSEQPSPVSRHQAQGRISDPSPLCPPGEPIFDAA